MKDPLFPEKINNWIGGESTPAATGSWFDNLNPADGKALCQVARSNQQDVEAAVSAAKKMQTFWAETPGVRRGEILHNLVIALKNAREEVARVVHLETGKSYASALGEVDGSSALGLFYASEGQRLYGKTTTSGAANRSVMTVRQPIGVAGLIIAANTPIANVAWKIFPALVCGNTCVLKAAEDTPVTAWIVGKLAKEAGLPDGVLNIVQGYGEEAGAPLVNHPDVGVISFTGSTAVGKTILAAANDRMARVSLELGGKNPFVVCDDADLDHAVNWAQLSAFSNAGQRCAAASRILVFDAVYDEFKKMLVEKTESLKVGPKDDDDFGPVINEKQLNNMLAAVSRAKDEGATLLTGGQRLEGADHQQGFYMAPTLLENVAPQAEISRRELFGPIASLYRVKDFNDALKLANDSPYGLTACIHTTNLHRAMQFCQKVEAGVVVTNAGTYGCEPHMPFGGRKQSGNGTREPGSEALDVYSELKDIFINVDPNAV